MGTSSRLAPVSEDAESEGVSVAPTADIPSPGAGREFVDGEVATFISFGTSMGDCLLHHSGFMLA